VEPVAFAELRDIVEGTAVWDEDHATKQPDWSHDATWGGRMPVERFEDHRSPDRLAR